MVSVFGLGFVHRTIPHIARRLLVVRITMVIRHSYRHCPWLPSEGRTTSGLRTGLIIRNSLRGIYLVIRQPY